LEAWQRPFLALSSCRKPVIAAVHGACIGGGVDLISACDVRLASQDAYFSIREVKVGMVAGSHPCLSCFSLLTLWADLGTLQRISRIMNVSSANLMAFSGAGFRFSLVSLFSEMFFHKDFPASQMLSWGLLSNVYPTKAGGSLV
jgi:delta(3,5)-delta(2,4)-dienoyl-CoA isomerase